MPSVNHRQVIAVQQLPENKHGRDFCVGDIHGMFGMLDQLLDKAQFDSAADRLISVGDLVDRGPSSMMAVDFLNQPWFYAIRGNHEDMLIRCYEDPEDHSSAKMWEQNGGKWWLETSSTDQEAIYQAVKPLPLALQIETRIGSMGVVHADLPPSIDWQGFAALLEAGDETTMQTALWSRTRAKLYKLAGEVSGITRIYCGHNIVDAPLEAGNVRYIDTGAYLPKVGKLTMVEIGLADEPSISVAAK